MGHTLPVVVAAVIKGSNSVEPAMALDSMRAVATVMSLVLPARTV